MIKRMVLIFLISMGIGQLHAQEDQSPGKSILIELIREFPPPAATGENIGAFAGGGALEDALVALHNKGLVPSFYGFKGDANVNRFYFATHI